MILLLLLFHCWLYCSPGPSLASHGVRQRKSSVPLREVVDTSKSRSTALIAGPAGRKAVFGLSDECPHCDPRKCAVGGSDRDWVSTTGLWCLSIRRDDQKMEQKCVSTREELNRALGMPEQWSQKPQGCERAEQGEGAEMCWCQLGTQKSLLEKGLSAADSHAAVHRHARRRKNHHGRQATAPPPPQSLATTRLPPPKSPAITASTVTAIVTAPMPVVAVANNAATMCWSLSIVATASMLIAIVTIIEKTGF